MDGGGAKHFFKAKLSAYAKIIKIIQNTREQVPLTDLVKLRNDAERICIGKDKHKLIDNHYNNAIEYKPITREDTSIISNGIMLIHKGFGGKAW